MSRCLPAIPAAASDGFVRKTAALSFAVSSRTLAMSEASALRSVGRVSPASACVSALRRACRTISSARRCSTDFGKSSSAASMISAIRFCAASVWAFLLAATAARQSACGAAAFSSTSASFRFSSRSSAGFAGACPGDSEAAGRLVAAMDRA